jgi:MoaA/NifB/PqqE/SkfB family radical SAM enzyme
MHVKESFHPIIAYLFTEWKCNCRCDYCYTYDNSVSGMTLDTAVEAIEWLRSVGCRVLAIMGGEPLLRKEFILEIIRHASERGFFVYVPTNGFLLDKAFLDQAGDSGLSALNLAVDCVEPRPGLPKALRSIDSQYQALLEAKKRFGFLAFFNINITSSNLLDVRLLTEIAFSDDIGCDYHVIEPPVIPQPHIGHDLHDLCITPDQWNDMDELIDFINDKVRQGLRIVNSRQHMQQMKNFVRGSSDPWPCRAGQNCIVVRIDGTLAPCFEMYSSIEDWGKLGQHQLDQARLKSLKNRCNRKCLSTCNYNLASYYDAKKLFSWLVRNTIFTYRNT